MEKDFLQSLKIEISKNFKLVPYERNAFHRILGIMKSENGLRILLRELKSVPEVRESAISVLKSFDSPQLLPLFTEMLLGDECGLAEKMHILDHLERFGSAEHAVRLIEFIEGRRGANDATGLLLRAFEVLKVIGTGSEEVLKYLKSVAANKEAAVELRCGAIEGLSAFRDISLYEGFIRERNDDILHSVFLSIAAMSQRLLREARDSRTEGDSLYTYSPELEDKLILDIRVLLSKVAVNFDSYSKRVKIAFIFAIICSNHREFIIYAMKALTSEDTELVELTLNLLLANTDKLRDPDKILRNLLALTAETQRENEIIVSIFERYFTSLPENRNNALLRDKLYNYMVVTLEAYFETYRKEFMITGIVEKDFPENFQRIRKYLLNNYTPALKKRMVFFLKNEGRSAIGPLLAEMASRIPYLREGDIEELRLLLDVFFDSDPKSRSISASRIDDINFEKRFLRNRIIRICEIIGRLGIEESASLLVKIFNYVKKYPDSEIFEAVARSLSMLNYTYMQGELEVLLASGDERERQRAVQLLALFMDQRSFNILLDFLKEREGETPEMVAAIMRVLFMRDLAGNTAANALFKRLIEHGTHAEIRQLAILCVGKGGVESDIEYLNELFSRAAAPSEKEAIVEAIGYIVQLNTAVNKRQVIKYLNEYLKEPAIKVRIFSCSLLIQLGNKEALRFVRDMMIIKNKHFQREILSIIGHQKSAEFAYFLISLLKEEYGITNDIIPILAQLPKEDMQEIDHFAVNIFKKYETADMEIGVQADAAAKGRNSREDGGVEKTLLNVELFDYFRMSSRMSIIEIIIANNIVEGVIHAEIAGRKGTLCKLSEGRILAYFDDAASAAESALSICRTITAFNALRLPRRWIRARIQLITGRSRIANEEILELPETAIAAMRELPAANRVLIDEATRGILAKTHHCESFPETTTRRVWASRRFFELVSPVNFSGVAEGILNELTVAEQKRIAAEAQLEIEMKKRKGLQKSESAIEYAQAIDDIGKMLKGDLSEIVRYVQKRSTDRELITTVEKLVNNVNKRYLVESSKIIVQ